MIQLIKKLEIFLMKFILNKNYQLNFLNVKLQVPFDRLLSSCKVVLSCIVWFIWIIYVMSWSSPKRKLLKENVLNGNPETLTSMKSPFYQAKYFESHSRKYVDVFYIGHFDFSSTIS